MSETQVAEPVSDARVVFRPKREFNPELDGVRGMAMVAVFLFHCAPRTGVGFMNAFFASFWPAIDVFFALSGFLITRNLLDDELNTHRFRNFYVNRALRIVPAYLLLLLIIFGLLPSNQVMAQALQGVPNLWWFLTYAFNFEIAVHDGWPANHLMNHFWSLCVEEQFYLLWPPLVYLVHQRWRVHLLAGMFVIAGGAEILLLMQRVDWAVIHTSVFTRLDSLVIGAVAAFLHRSSKRMSVVPVFTLVFWLCSAVLVSCGVATSGLRFTLWHSHPVVHPVLMVWSATLVYLLINGQGHFRKIARVFRVRFFVVVGTYSYGIYLFHWIIYMSFVELDAFGWKTASPWGNFAIVAISTVVLALLSYNLLEKQCLKLKLRAFEPRVSDRQ